MKTFLNSITCRTRFVFIVLIPRPGVPTTDFSEIPGECESRAPLLKAVQFALIRSKSTSAHTCHKEIKTARNLAEIFLRLPSSIMEYRSCALITFPSVRLPSDQKFFFTSQDRDLYSQRYDIKIW